MMRCRHDIGQGNDMQCRLQDGHAGEHMNAYQEHLERSINLNPTLADIRRVVREEIRAALTVSDER